MYFVFYRKEKLSRLLVFITFTELNFIIIVFLELMLFIMFIMEDIFWNDCKWLSKTWIFLLRLVTHE